MEDYGINLKNAIKAKKLTAYKLSRMTGIPATTIYSAIQRNSGIRYDCALRIADVFKIRPEQICGHALTSPEDKTKNVENIEEILRQIRETRRFRLMLPEGNDGSGTAVQSGKARGGKHGLERGIEKDCRSNR